MQLYPYWDFFRTLVRFVLFARAFAFCPCRLHLLQPVRGLRNKATPFASADSEPDSSRQIDRLVKKMSMVPKQMSSVGANLDHIGMLVQDLTRYLHEKAGDDPQKVSKGWSKDYAERTDDNPLQSSSEQGSSKPALARTRTVSVNRKQHYFEDDV